MSEALYWDPEPFIIKEVTRATKSGWCYLCGESYHEGEEISFLGFSPQHLSRNGKDWAISHPECAIDHPGRKDRSAEPEKAPQPPRRESAPVNPFRRSSQPPRRESAPVNPFRENRPRVEITVNPFEAAAQPAQDKRLTLRELLTDLYEDRGSLEAMARREGQEKDLDPEWISEQDGIKVETSVWLKVITEKVGIWARNRSRGLSR